MDESNPPAGIPPTGYLADDQVYRTCLYDAASDAGTCVPYDYSSRGGVLQLLAATRCAGVDLKLCEGSVSTCSECTQIQQRGTTDSACEYTGFGSGAQNCRPTQSHGETMLTIADSVFVQNFAEVCWPNCAGRGGGGGALFMTGGRLSITSSDFISPLADGDPSHPHIIRNGALLWLQSLDHWAVRDSRFLDGKLDPSAFTACSSIAPVGVNNRMPTADCSVPAPVNISVNTAETSATRVS
jgi:hypothetical protein